MRIVTVRAVCQLRVVNVRLVGATLTAVGLLDTTSIVTVSVGSESSTTV